jgi:hypothetical protein
MVKRTGAIFRTMKNTFNMICEHSFMLYVEKDIKYSVMYFKNGLKPIILHMAKLSFPSLLPDPYVQGLQHV